MKSVEEVHRRLTEAGFRSRCDKFGGLSEKIQYTHADGRRVIIQCTIPRANDVEFLFTQVGENWGNTPAEQRRHFLRVIQLPSYVVRESVDTLRALEPHMPSDQLRRIITAVKALGPLRNKITPRHDRKELKAIIAIARTVPTLRDKLTDSMHPLDVEEMLATEIREAMGPLMGGVHKYLQSKGK